MALLAEVDEAFGQLSGPATKVILWRMRHVYGDERFERFASISNGHIYNLRKSRTYRTGRLTFRNTQPKPVPIGVRRKPQPDGSPGFLPVDTVHLGDLGGRNGTYIVNIVDEVTQFQHLGALRRITQHFMAPVLEDLISAFPFTVHAVPQVNGFLCDDLCPFLNFHRPCLFPTEVTSTRSRVTKTYRQADVATRHQHFRSLPGAERFLRPEVTFDALDQSAAA